MHHHLFQLISLFQIYLVDIAHCLANSLFFDVPLLFFYINLRSSIIFCLSSGDIHLSLGISLSCSFVTAFE